MRERYSYRWASERVNNVLGLAFAVPKKEEDAPKESIMKSGEKPSPNLVKAWMRGTANED